MTGPAYPFKNLEQAKAIRQAADRTAAWGPETVGLVVAAMPPAAREAGHEERDWCTTVEALRTKEWETPVMAAERIARWVQLHAELYGAPMTQLSMQRTHPPTSVNRSRTW